MPVRAGLIGHLAEELAALRDARHEYIRHGFSLRYAGAYCRAYCSLLRSVLERISHQEGTPLALLWSILGFECFGLRCVGEDRTVAAATCCARNPTYLLSKLSKPDSRDDPKNLPLLTVFDDAGNDDSVPQLYYHYRQLKLNGAKNISLLVYPSAHVADRPRSFVCIQAFTFGLRSGIDPRSRERAKYICDLSVGPFMEKRLSMTGLSGDHEVGILDLGGGSGSLTHSIHDNLLAKCPEVMNGRRFSWMIVDVKPHNLRRHVKNRKFFRRLARFQCERSDYQSWIERTVLRPDRRSFHLALVCRLFNNLSHFSIGWIDDWYQIRKLSKGLLTYPAWQRGDYLPLQCLDKVTARADGLLASKARVPLLRGSTFRQLSLTDYFQGLYILTERSKPPGIGTNAVFFPIRRFNDKSLTLPSGKSVINLLCSMADMCVIEDIDLHGPDLRRHLASHRLTNLAASDATNSVFLQSSSLLCICRGEYKSYLPGKRIW